LKTFTLTLFASSILLLGACASAPKDEPPKDEPPKTVPAPTNVTLEELNTAIEGGVMIQNEKGEEVICRREAKTGSRLARETICMTKSEWLRVSEESQRATRKSMRQGRIPHGT
jgi:hypothetical protein